MHLKLSMNNICLKKCSEWWGTWTKESSGWLLLRQTFFRWVVQLFYSYTMYHVYQSFEMIMTLIRMMIIMVFQKIWINPNISILKVMTDWLAPMPDKGLPHVNMRSKSNNKALHGCISSCKGLFPYYVSQNQGSWALPPPSSAMIRIWLTPQSHPSPRQLSSAFARCPFCTSNVGGYSFVRVQFACYMALINMYG